MKGVSAVIIIFGDCYLYSVISLFIFLLFDKEMTIGLPPVASGMSLVPRGTNHIFQPLRRRECLEME